MKILIVKLSAIGDVIHTLPALNAIRRHYPDAEIDWLVEEAAASVVEGHAALDRVIVSRRKRWLRALRNGPNRIATLRSILRFIREIRATRYDLIIDFQQLMKSGLMVWLARGNVKAGFDGGMAHMEESHRFLNRRIPPVSMEIHALERYLILVRALGIPVAEIEYNIPVGDADRTNVGRMLRGARAFGVRKLELSGVRKLELSGEGRGARTDLPPLAPEPSRPLVAINPVAQWPTKLWDTAGFAQVADRLIREFGADVVFTGGPADRPVVAEILEKMERSAADLTGRTNLKELAALYEGARLVISTDTGPMHLAAAVGTPVVALFGPTAPRRTGPFGDGHQVVRLSLDCAPCFKRRCARGDTACMAGISVDEVVACVQLRIEN